MLDRTYHPVYQASIAATAPPFGSELLDLELVPTHSELGLRLCGNQIYGALSTTGRVIAEKGLSEE